MSIVPTNILLATDGSRDALLAATTAADLANSTNSELHVVHVGHYLPPSFSYLGVGMEDYGSMSKRHAEELLHEQVQEIQEAGGSVKEAHTELGMPDTEIVNLAETIGANLIVMGARGLGGPKRALIGSVADSVVRHAHCPVMVIRELPQEGHAKPY